MYKNPFKFGSIVEGEYFANRQTEIKEVKSILSSENHLVLISPRRYGKTSLINKVVKDLKRKFIVIDLQIITTPEDFAAELLKRIYRTYPFEKIKQFLKNFKVVPSITVDPLTNNIDIIFKTAHSPLSPLEDVLNLIEKLASVKNKTVVIFDEFQEITRINKELDRYLRAVMQYHQNINYVFLGSQESLIRQIFEKKKSSFYHFGYVFPLDKIPRSEFKSFLSIRFKEITSSNDNIADAILEISGSHPYYTQQLAFIVWEIIGREENTGSANVNSEEIVESAVSELIIRHDIDYERLWNTLNRTDMKLLIGMSFSENSPLSKEFLKQFDIGAQSTVFSSIKRLMQNGFIVKHKSGYEIDDPFLKKWIKERRLR